MESIPNNNQNNFQQDNGNFNSFPMNQSDMSMNINNSNQMNFQNPNMNQSDVGLNQNNQQTNQNNVGFSFYNINQNDQNNPLLQNPYQIQQNTPSFENIGMQVLNEEGQSNGSHFADLMEQKENLKHRSIHLEMMDSKLSLRKNKGNKFMNIKRDIKFFLKENIYNLSKRIDEIQTDEQYCEFIKIIKGYIDPMKFKKTDEDIITLENVGDSKFFENFLFVLSRALLNSNYLEEALNILLALVDKIDDNNSDEIVLLLFKSEEATYKLFLDILTKHRECFENNKLDESKFDITTQSMNIIEKTIEIISHLLLKSDTLQGKIISSSDNLIEKIVNYVPKDNPLKYSELVSMFLCEFDHAPLDKVAECHILYSTIFEIMFYIYHLNEGIFTEEEKRIVNNCLGAISFIVNTDNKDILSLFFRNDTLGVSLSEILISFAEQKCFIIPVINIFINISGIEDPFYSRSLIEENVLFFLRDLIMDDHSTDEEKYYSMWALSNFAVDTSNFKYILDNNVLKSVILLSNKQCSILLKRQISVFYSNLICGASSDDFLRLAETDMLSTLDKYLQREKEQVVIYNILRSFWNLIHKSKLIFEDNPQHNIFMILMKAMNIKGKVESIGRKNYHDKIKEECQKLMNEIE